MGKAAAADAGGLTWS